MSYPQQAGYAPPPYQATVIVPPPVRTTYGVNNSDPRWRTCCCHVYTCTIIIAILEGFGLVGQLLFVMSAVPMDITADAVKYSSPSACFLVIGIVVLTLLALGLRQKRALFLIPHLIFQVISVLICIVMTVLVVVAIVFSGVIYPETKVSTETEYRESGTGDIRFDSEWTPHAIGRLVIAVCIGLIWLLAAGLEIWWFVVVLRCYRWLREAAFRGPGVGAYATYTTGYPQQGAPLLHQGPGVGAFATNTVTTTTGGYPQQGAPLLHQEPAAGAYATYTTTTTTAGYPQQGATLLHQAPDTKQPVV